MARRVMRSILAQQKKKKRRHPLGSTLLARGFHIDCRVGRKARENGIFLIFSSLLISSLLSLRFRLVFHQENGKWKRNRTSNLKNVTCSTCRQGRCDQSVARQTLLAVLAVSAKQIDSGRPRWRLEFNENQGVINILTWNTASKMEKTGPNPLSSCLLIDLFKRFLAVSRP